MDIKPRIMVCVTRQRTCERLIQAGAHMARQLGANLFVVHVVKTGSHFLGNDEEGEALEYLFRISKAFGADMSVLRADNVLEKLVKYAKMNKISLIVMGTSPDMSENNIIQSVRKRLPSTPVHIVVNED